MIDLAIESAANDPPRVVYPCRARRRACIRERDPGVVFEGDEGADPSETWCYQRVTDCPDGEFTGTCRSHPPVGVANED